jgi:serine phosphatase RsbU (regulator of sigma subunit)
MNLRTKLILVFFLIAVVPLAGVTLFSYHSSRQALRRAVEADSAALAQELQRRMESTTQDINRRIARLREMPMEMLMPGGSGPQGDAEHSAARGQIITAMGDVAPFIESLEITPQQPEAPKIPPPPRPARSSGVGPPPPPPTPPMQVFRFQFGTNGNQSPESLKKTTEQIALEVQKQAQEIAQAARSTSPPDLRQIRVLEAKNRELGMSLGRQFAADLTHGGEVVGHVRAQVRTRQLLRSVLSRGRRGQGEIPFALDSEGKIHTDDPEDQKKLEAIPLRTAGPVDSQSPAANWVIATRQDQASGLTFGIARPIGQQIQEIRQSAVRNLLYGLGMVALAMVAIIPLSSRMTKNIAALTLVAGKLADGDRASRVQIQSRDEIGRLAQAFNRMAEDLDKHEKNLVEQERLRRELELCREIQEELLPPAVFHSGVVEARGVSIPAREVGGDFFNYFQLPSGAVALLIGDVSGKGLPAALLMANIQATLQAKLPLEANLSELAVELDHQIDESTPPEVYLTLFMGIFEPENRVLRYVNAGHNTQFALHAGGRVERFESTGRPLGLLPGGAYEERSAVLNEGDYLFLYTDGLAEAENDAEEEFGTQRLERLLAVDAQGGVDGVLARVEEAVKEHRGNREAADDATMMLVRIGP